MRLALVPLLALALFACSSKYTKYLLPVSNAQRVAPQTYMMAMTGGNTASVCTVLTPGSAKCPAILNLSVGFLNNVLAVAGIIPGLHPSDIRSAYGLPSSSGGARSTVAVIAKGDDPNAASDLAVYRKTFGLSPCTSANGCFRKVNEAGSSAAFPAGDQQWSMEIALDLDMVSAVCPNCHILLVEAQSASLDDLGTAVDTAASLGATEISNSYYAPEYAGETAELNHYDHPGIPMTASSGDDGSGATFPASAPNVIAVGGTTLTRAPNARGWSESTWNASGSGCSLYVAKPSWQSSSCASRAIADVAVVADPNTGVAAYNSYAPVGERGWAVYGGTSIGAPVVAAAFALAGNATSVTPAYAYAHPQAFYAIGGGSTTGCDPACLGAPHGTAAF
jgi:subtilase family serine protease